ncbi:MAG: hypothetical protein HFJ36_04585 [Clostridia bacterium]|nr:hypothetical protein [Clostridia bacterium]
MEKILKKSSWTDIIVSLLFILFGIMLVARPESIMSIISFLLGAICVVMGLLKGVDYFASGKSDNYLLALAIVAVLSGIIIMFCAGIIVSIFRILIAIWIIYSGIMNLQTTIVWKDYKSKLWLTTLILAICMIIAGIYILMNNGAMLQIIGGIIIVYGIFDIVESMIFIKKIENYLD